MKKPRKVFFFFWIHVSAQVSMWKRPEDKISSSHLPFLAIREKLFLCLVLVQVINSYFGILLVADHNIYLCPFNVVAQKPKPCLLSTKRCTYPIGLLSHNLWELFSLRPLYTFLPLEVTGVCWPKIQGQHSQNWSMEFKRISFGCLLVSETYSDLTLHGASDSFDIL